MRRAAAALLAALSVSVVGCAWRAAAPLGEPVPVHAPRAERFALSNGLRVIFIADSRQPLLTARLAVAGGTAHFARRNPALVEALAALLVKGSARRGARELAEAAAAFGGAVVPEATPDHVIVRAWAPAGRAGPMLELLAEVCAQPAFPEPELALRRTGMLAELRRRREEPDSLASALVYRRLYPDHPYGRVSPSEEELGAIRREDLVALHARLFTVENARLVLVGDARPEALREALEAAFASWPPAAALPLWKLPAPAPAAAGGLRVALLDRPGSERTELVVGHEAVTEAHPDYFPLLVVSEALGGSVAARLTPRWSAGELVVRTSVRAAAAVPALKAILKRLRRVRAWRLSRRDLARAQSELIASFARELKTQEGLADAVLRGELFGLGEDHLDAFAGKVRAVTREAAREAARRHIRPDRAAVAVVGDARLFGAALGRLADGAVAAVDETGAPLPR